MKMKSILSAAAICALTLCLAACSSKPETKEKPEEKKEDFDAAAYTTAYLNAEFKGDFAEYARLSGQSEDELTARYEEHINELVTLSIGENTDAPGSEPVPPQTQQDFTTLWTTVLQNFKYQVKEAEPVESGYTVTVETQKMQLFGPMADAFTELIANPETPEDGQELSYLSLMLQAYTTALNNITYADPVTVNVRLSKNENNSWTISDEDMEHLTSGLLDTEAGSAQADPSIAPEDVQTEASPDTTYPETLDEDPAYPVGETFTIIKDGQDMASFCIDQVEVTEERSEFDPSNPEKVIRITYTYKNLGLETPLLYDSMSFRILEGETVCEPYYLQTLISPDIAQKGGEPVTASISYGVSASCTEVTIYVDGTQIDYPFSVTAPLA